ncbi:MAG TPA: hypothetical protein VM537_37195, partial [Anaerolineae bacterium]|nr:hypothetical protein [Anaerolineae bacterium]
MARLQPIQLVNPGQFGGISEAIMAEGRATGSGYLAIGAGIAGGLQAIGRHKEANSQRQHQEKMQADRLQVTKDLEEARLRRITERQTIEDKRYTAQTERHSLLDTRAWENTQAD